MAFAADHGATWVEGYPKDTEGARKDANEMFVGSMSMFAEAGFTRPAAAPLSGRSCAGGWGSGGSRLAPVNGDQRPRRPRRARR